MLGDRVTCFWQQFARDGSCFVSPELQTRPLLLLLQALLLLVSPSSLQLAAILQLHHCVTAFLSYCVIALLHYCIIALLHSWAPPKGLDSIPAVPV